MFSFSNFEYHTFYVLYPFVTHLLTLPRKFKQNTDIYFVSPQDRCIHEVGICIMHGTEDKKHTHFILKILRKDHFRDLGDSCKHGNAIWIRQRASTHS
jgi:hypothetical protein